MGRLTDRVVVRMLIAALACAVIFNTTQKAGAAEPKKPAAAPAPVEAPAEPGKKLVEEKPFVFEPRDRRDPFTFLKKVDVPVEPTVRPGDGSAPVITVDVLVIQQKKAEADAHYAAAEKAFLDIGKDGKAQEVIAKCDAGLKIFADLPNLNAVRELQEIRERLTDMRKAGDRVKVRHESEKRFREVHVRLTGVVARDRRSTAIVNGQPVFKGDVLAAAENYNVVVDDINADRVVFVTPEGFKTMVTLSEMAK